MTEAEQASTIQAPLSVDDAVSTLETALTELEGVGNLLDALSGCAFKIEASALNPVVDVFAGIRERADAAFKVLFPVLLDAVRDRKAA